jgi:hypothetical protein
MPHPTWLFDETIIDELFSLYQKVLPLHEWMVAMMKTIPIEE